MQDVALVEVLHARAQPLHDAPPVVALHVAVHHLEAVAQPLLAVLDDDGVDKAFRILEIIYF